MASLTDIVTRPRLIGRADVWLAVLSAAALAFMMIFICVGVVLRYVFNMPIAGTNEVLELSSVAFVMLALPYCTTQDAHVRIDLLDSFLGRAGLFATEILYRIVGIAVLSLMAKANVTRMLDAIEYDDATNMIEIALWPFYGLIVFGMGLYAAILALQLIAMFSIRGAGK